MGYKYGVWYVYSKNVFNTKHMSHFTVACLMNKKDMYDLYYSIRDIFGYTNAVIVNCKESKVFDNNMYKDDNNDLHSWGYEGQILHWNVLKSLLIDYKCNYTDNNHTTIQYSNNKEDLDPYELDHNKSIICRLVCVDMNDDNPENWKIII